MDNEYASIVRAYESAIARIVLLCVSELPFPLGIRKTSDVLKGSKATFILRYELQSLRTYGILSHYSRAKLDVIIGSICKAGFLCVEYIAARREMPLVQMLPAGLEFLKSDQQYSFGFADELADRVVTSLTSKDKQLYETLRRHRLKIARGLGIPAYMLLGAPPLVQMAIEKPTTEEEIVALKGLGQLFKNDYVGSFLTVLNEWKLKDREVLGEPSSP